MHVHCIDPSVAALLVRAPISAPACAVPLRIALLELARTFTLHKLVALALVVLCGLFIGDEAG